MNSRELLIIGGGICGMTAAIYAARAKLDVAIIEKHVCGGLVNWTHTVENMPSYTSIHGLELMEKCRGHVESLNVPIHEVELVERVDFSGNMKTLTTTEGIYQAKAVIIATGRYPVPLPVETDFEKVHYCSVCDGTAYAGKDVLVIGGGNSGFDESLYLTALGVNSVHIVEMMPMCVAAESTQEKARQSGKIHVSTSLRLTSVEPTPDGQALVQLTHTKSGEVSEEKVDGIFCFMGQIPNTKVFLGAVDMENGYVRTDADMHTSAHGVFAAGDVIVKKYRQITTAMSDGTIAALEADKYIRAFQ